MTIEQAHIEFRNQLQELGNYLGTGLRAEKIDFVLNKQMRRFMDETYRPAMRNNRLGGFKDIERIEDLESLITPVTLPVIYQDSEWSEVVIPANYFRFVSCSPGVLLDCSAPESNLQVNSFSYVVFDPSLELILGLNELGHAEDFVGLSIKITQEAKGGGTVETVVYVNKDHFPNGIDGDEFYFQYINVLLTELNRNSVDMQYYWETFGDIYKPGQIIAVDFNTTNSYLTTVTICYDEAENGVKVFDDYQTIVNQAITTGDYKGVGFRVVPNDLETDFTQNPYRKTQKDDVLLLFEEGKIKISTSGFTVANFKLKYIRYPIPMNINTGQGCELGSTFPMKERIMQQIINRAVAEVSGVTMSDNSEYLNILQLKRD